MVGGFQTLIRAMLSTNLILLPFLNPFAVSADESLAYYSYSSNPNEFRPPSNPNLDLNNFNRPLSFDFRSLLAPDLNLNMWTMRLPVIQVRDFGEDLWTFEKTGSHFNPELKLYDQYAANIRLRVGGAEAAEPIQMDLGKMKFESGFLTPRTFRQIFQDGIGNTLIRERSSQRAEANPKYQQFIQFFQREGAGQLRGTAPFQMKGSGGGGKALSRPPDPSKELVLGFKESWELKTPSAGGGTEKAKTEFEIESVKHDSNFQRFISEYSGKVRNGNDTIQFEVKSPHEIDGKIKSLEIKIWGERLPETTVSWTPAEGKDKGEAINLLRQNLPLPLLVGPNTALRLNGVDLSPSPA